MNDFLEDLVCLIDYDIYKDIFVHKECPELLKDIKTLYMDYHSVSNIADKNIKDAINLSEKHGMYNSLHEGYGVMLEEFDEVWDEIKKKESKRNLKNLDKELCQVIACAVKMRKFIESKK